MPEITPIPLAELTTLRTGGTPTHLIEATDRSELIAVLRQLWADDEPWLILGGGSNVLIGDDGFDGTVVLVRTRGIEQVPGARPGFTRLRVEAGHDWDELVAYAVDHGLAGIEAMSGIPGTVGAAPVQNIGAYGQELVQTIVEVELLDESTGDLTVVPASVLGLGFRTSVLKHHYGSAAPRSAVVVSVTLELEVAGGDARAVDGLQLRQALGLDEHARVSLGWIRDHVLETRARKGMVLDDDDPDTYSAGSFFQNPVIPESAARALPAECPRWEMSPTIEPLTIIPLESYDGFVPRPVDVPRDVKISAAWLIEQAGLRRGYSLPRSRAGLSSKHTLALTNRGGARAEELAELARFVQQRVQSEFGLLLQPEPVLLGVEL